MNQKKKHVVTQLGVRQQTISRTFLVELSESRKDEIGSGDALDDMLSDKADEMGVHWIADESDVWDDPDSIEVDAEDVGDLYDDRYAIVSLPKREAS